MKLLKSNVQTRKLLMKQVMDEINLNKERRFLHDMIIMSRQYDNLRKRLTTFLSSDIIPSLTSSLSRN